MANELDVRVARVWLGDDGILRCALKAHAAMERSDAEETFRALLSAGGGIPRPVMALIANLKWMSREARTVFTTPEGAQLGTAVGIVVGSPLTRMIGQFFMGLNKPHMPARLFDDEASALAWLRGFL